MPIFNIHESITTAELRDRLGGWEHSGESDTFELVGALMLACGRIEALERRVDELEKWKAEGEAAVAKFSKQIEAGAFAVPAEPEGPCKFDHDALIDAQEHEYLFEAVDHERKMIVTVTLDHLYVIERDTKSVRCVSVYYDWVKYFALTDLYPMEVGAELPEGYTREPLPPEVTGK